MTKGLDKVLDVQRNRTGDSAELPEEQTQPGKKVRGPRSANQGMLWGDREALVGLLSAMWADIGWELLHAKTAADIRQALSPLKTDSRQSLIDHFLRESSSQATAGEVRKSSADSSLKHERRIDAQNRRDALRKDFEEVQLAQTQATPEQLSTIEPIFLSGRAEYETAEISLRAAEKEQRDAEAKLVNQEAGFAQEELLKFIRSRKYAHNPLNLANAMAGLRCHTSGAVRVHAGCWQSFARCSKLECAIWPTYQFQRFEAIRSIWNRQYKYPTLSPVELFRQEIPKLPKTTQSVSQEFPARITKAKKKRIVNGFVRDSFMQEFRYLRLAIEESLQNANYPERVPFLILAHFTNKAAQASNAVEKVLVISERLGESR